MSINVEKDKEKNGENGKEVEFVTCVTKNNNSSMIDDGEVFDSLNLSMDKYKNYSSMTDDGEVFDSLNLSMDKDKNYSSTIDKDEDENCSVFNSSNLSMNNKVGVKKDKFNIKNLLMNFKWYMSDEYKRIIKEDAEAKKKLYKDINEDHGTDLSYDNNVFVNMGKIAILTKNIVIKQLKEKYQ